MRNFEYRLHHASGRVTKIVLLGNTKREAEDKIKKFHPKIAESKSYCFLGEITLQYSTQSRRR